MGALIRDDGTMTDEAHPEFLGVAQETGLPAEIVEVMARELRLELNKHGGIDCTAEKFDEIWTSIQRKHCIPEEAILREVMRRH